MPESIRRAFQEDKTEAPPELFAEALKAARTLTTLQPYEGSQLVAKGWSQFVCARVLRLFPALFVVLVLITWG